MKLGRQMVEDVWNWVRGFTTDDFRWFVTFVVAVGSLVVAYFSYRVSKNSVEISSEMKEIAERADLHAVRPYIIIPDDAWFFDVIEFSSGNQQARIQFSAVHNAGQGPATRMFARLRVSYPSDASEHFINNGINPFASGGFDGTVASYVPEKETASTSFTGFFTWPPPNPRMSNGGMVSVHIDIFSWDVEERRYKSTFTLFASHRAWNCLGPQLTGPVARVENNQLIVEGLSHPPDQFSRETVGLCFAQGSHEKSPEGPMNEEPAVTLNLPDEDSTNASAQAEPESPQN